MIRRKNKRNMSSKRVSFHKKLTKDSPIHKSRPNRELSLVIKIGGIFCPVMKDSCKVFGEASISSDAPVKHACSCSPTATLTNVPIHLNLDHAAKTQQSVRFNDGLPPQGEHFSFFPSHATRLCFRCLSPAHLVKDCRGRLVVFTASIMVIGLVTVSRDK